jgi:hypothetical protein
MLGLHMIVRKPNRIAAKAEEIAAFSNFQNSSVPRRAKISQAFTQANLTI